MVAAGHHCIAGLAALLCALTLYAVWEMTGDTQAHHPALLTQTQLEALNDHEVRARAPRTEGAGAWVARTRADTRRRCVVPSRK